MMAEGTGSSNPVALSTEETRKDLTATLAARSELSPDMQEHLIGAFLDRIEQRIDARVDERLAHSKVKQGGQGRSSNPVEVVASSLGISIPLVAIAGAMAGGVGVTAVMAVVLIINVIYFLHEADIRHS